jgi:hypothetical protein
MAYECAHWPGFHTPACLGPGKITPTTLIARVLLDGRQLFPKASSSKP